MTPDPVLTVDGVCKRFGDLRAVDRVSFEVRRGEVFGFLGPNGAGKTTTLRMIMGITRPDEGRVGFAGADGLDPARVGYLPEERGLFEDAGVFDTLVYLARLRRLSLPAARAAARQWLERLDLADRGRDNVGTLSKGNQQKVQFAGAVLHRPALAVLDEPFSGLDPLNQELFLEQIGGLRAAGAAVLVSAHQLDLVERLCDRICLIAGGRPLLAGTLNELRRAVAGGADEVLAVTLRSRGDGDAAAVAAILEAAAPGAPARVRAGANGMLEAEVSLAAGADLSTILARLAAHPIERVTMRPLRLHEIYVRAVRGAGGDGATAGEVADG